MESFDVSKRRTLFVLATFLLLSGCGGGNTSTSGTSTTTPPASSPPLPTGDFVLSAESSSLSIQQGGTFTFQTIQATPSNGFTGTIQLALSGLPTGVTATPSGLGSLTIGSGGNPQDLAFQLEASRSAAVGLTTATVTGTSGAITHTLTFSINVTQAAPWTIQAVPSSVSLTPGTSATVTVSVTSTAPTPPQLLLQLPDTSQLTGINFSTPQGFLTPTTPVNLIINPTPEALPQQNYPFVLTASDTSGNTGIVALSLTVTLPYSTNAAPTRSTFVRTDQSPTGMVYDQTRKLLFVSVEVLNEVVVLSTVDGHQVASIPVSYPAGIDESADGTAVYVVSQYINGITIIDPGLLQVVGHVDVPANVSGQTVGSSFFQVATLSNGTVLLLEAGSVILNPILQWTPATNSFALFGQMPVGIAGLFLRSADHSTVLVFAGTGGGILYNATTNNFTSPNSAITSYTAINPNGGQIISVGLQNTPTVFYDANLSPIASMQLDAFPITGVAYSLDGKYAYVLTQQNGDGGNVATVIDTTTFTVVGLIPGFTFGASLPFGGQSITTFAEDETGMLFGAAVKGVGFLDMTTFTSLSFPLPGTFFAQPTLASLTGPTSAQLNGAGFSQNFAFSLFVGAPPASPQSLQATNVSVQSANSLVATIPAGATAGSANVTLTRSDGFFEVMPDAISFGPTVLRVDPDAGSDSGGDTIEITGYGFDSGNPSVTIGGRSATVSTITRPISDELFPTESISMTTPSGLPGSADIVVSTASGSTTVTGGFQYLNSLQSYSKAGLLDAIVYDQPRQRLYITNQNHDEVEVFDLTSNTYLSAIPVGNGPSDLALTPDGTLLAVLDYVDGTVAVIDPTAMQLKATYRVLTSSDAGAACLGTPLSISPAAPHRMMVDIDCTYNLFGGLFHLIDLDTGSLSCTGVAGCASNGTDINFSTGIAALASTPDGTQIFLASSSGGGAASDVPVGLLNLTANTLVQGFTGDFSDAAIDADGTVFAANIELCNPQLNLTSITAIDPYIDAGGLSPNNVVGEKLNPAGSLLFVPQVSGVDIFDVHTGRLVQHVALPNPLPLNSNALALDETGTKMFLTSTTGVMIAELAQAPLSIGTVSPSAGSSGTTVNLRGSGFVSGAVVSFGTNQASTAFIDSNTLSATVPSMPSGPTRITVTNPNGQTYALDDAFTVN